MKMNWIVPLAGSGTRFKKAGFKVPKLLIDIDGAPMYAKAIESLPVKKGDRLVVIILKDHQAEFALADKIRERFGFLDLVVHEIDGVTSGQAETVLLGIIAGRIKGAFGIFNGDSAQYDDGLRIALEKNFSQGYGLVSTFSDNADRWSYVRSENGIVVEAAEKHPISSRASTGFYAFPDVNCFLKAIEAGKSQTIQSYGEFYVAPLINYMLLGGITIIERPVNRFYCFGTPEDLDAYKTGKCWI